MDYADFKREAGFSAERFDELMEKSPEKLSQHLVLARLIERWAKRMEQDETQSRMLGEDHVKGFVNGLRHVQVHLQQGDFLPGGAMHESLGDGQARALDDQGFKRP